MADTIYDFISLNWGNLASVLGTGLTVFYARKANSAAEAAKLAADGAKFRVHSVDLVLLFNSIVTDIDSLLQKIGREIDWESVSNDCVKLRSNAAVAFREFTKIGDEIIKGKLQQSATQFATITKIADTECRDKNQSANTVQIRKTLATQRELFSICLEMARKAAAGGNIG